MTADRSVSESIGWRFDGPIDVLVVLADTASSPSADAVNRLEETDPDSGLSVRTATDPAHALTALREDDVSCVVAGYDLDGTDGIEFLERVRDLDADVPFVLLAADGSEEIASRAISAGVTEYATPEEVIDCPATLAGRIENAVKNYHVERGLERNHLALETAQEGISLLDENGELRYVNETFAETYGYDREEMIGEHWEMLYPDGEIEEVTESVLPEVRERGFWQGETTGRRSDGTEFPERHSLATTHDDGLVCVIQDITEQKERERRVREQERCLRALCEVTADASLTFEEKLARVLDLGREQFDLELGAMARIDRDADRFVIEHVSGDHEHFEPGFQLPLSETYCSAVADSDDAVGVFDPIAAGHGDITVHREFGLRAYLGTCVEIEGDEDRTLFFVSREDREEAFSDEDLTFQRLLGRWVKYELDRERRERHLTALNALTRDLMDAEAAEAMSERVIEAGESELDLPIAGIALADDHGDLRSVAETEDGSELFRATSLLDPGSGAGWTAYVEGTAQRVTDATGTTDEGSGDDADASVPIGSYVSELVVHPLGKHGVLIAGTETADGFGPFGRGFVETVAANVEAALDRVDRERQLQQRERKLASQNETLERLTRINDIIRSIARALVSAGTREEIEEVVCEQLAEVGPYEFAWVGEYDDPAGSFAPSEWAGREDGFLDRFDDGDAPDRGPVATAVRSREPQVVEQMLEDPPLDEWRQEALHCNFHASASLPLVYEDSYYGVLNIYADRPDVFDELERAVLTELSDTIAYAINSVESKRALLSERYTELEFEIGDDRIDPVALTADADCEVFMESLVPRADGGLGAFFSTRGLPADDVEERIPMRRFDDVTLVSNYEEDGDPVCVFEAALTDESVGVTVLDHGGVVRRFSAVGGSATVLVELSIDADVRRFVDMLQAHFEDCSLEAQRTREESRQTGTEFTANVVEELTPRQLEVLKTAYFSGFFESPRERTGSEIATSMGVSQPTFTRHMRNAQRTICRLLFEDTLPLQH